MVIVEVMDVQLVTTRLKEKVAKWENQDAIQKQATYWIQRANQRNVDEMKDQAKPPKEMIRSTDNDPYW